MSLRSRLREATADDHARLDSTFGRYDLADPAAYRAFLRAHARALAPVEAVISAGGPPGGWAPRLPRLTDDLAALDETPPPPLPFGASPSAHARIWGARYVVEGSRLGGALLARSVAEGLPRAYLGARHEKGEWRDFLATLDQAGEDGGPDWQAEAVAGAKATFALFAAAAAMEDASHG